MEDTEWKYSNEVEKRFEEGRQYLTIQDAVYDEIKDTYTLSLTSLTTNDSIRVTYYLSSINEAGEATPDNRQRRTLITLKKALYGPEANGIPNPANIVGCAVLADVKASASKKDPTKLYPRIYSYEPVPFDIAVSFGKDDQYTVSEEE